MAGRSRRCKVAHKMGRSATTSTRSKRGSLVFIPPVYPPPPFPKTTPNTSEPWVKKDQIDLRLKGMNLDNLPVSFFNAKEDAVLASRDQLIGMIVEYRRRHEAQIAEVAAVNHLIQNQANEEVRLIFEEVGRHLSTWIERNRKIDWEDMGVQKSLLAATDGMRYAGKIRAAVNRRGENYPELD